MSEGDHPWTTIGTVVERYGLNSPPQEAFCEWRGMEGEYGEGVDDGTTTTTTTTTTTRRRQRPCGGDDPNHHTSYDEEEVVRGWGALEKVVRSLTSLEDVVLRHHRHKIPVHGVLVEEVVEDDMDGRNDEEDVYGVVCSMGIQGMGQTCGGHDVGQKLSWVVPRCWEYVDRVCEMLSMRMSVAPRKGDTLEEDNGEETGGGHAQRFVDAVLPVVLPKLCERVAAYATFQKSVERATKMNEYEGPDEWTRSMASCTLVWMVHVMSFDEDVLCEDDLRMLVSTVVQGSNDPSLLTRNVCLHALQIIVERAPLKTMPRFLQNDVVPALKRSMQGADEKSWYSIYNAVAACIAAYRDTGADLMPTSVQQAYRYQHKHVFARQWLAGMKHSFVPLGPSIVQYSSTLLPVLLEWCQAFFIKLQIEAFDALKEFFIASLQRSKVHTKVVWNIMVVVLDREGGPSEIDSVLLDRMQAVANVLWISSSIDFRNSKRENGDYFSSRASSSLDAHSKKT